MRRFKFVVLYSSNGIVFKFLVLNTNLVTAEGEGDTSFRFF